MRELQWLEMLFFPLLSFHILGHSHTNLEINFGKKHGSMISLKRKFPILRELIHFWFLLLQQIKQYGKENNYRQTEFLLKTLPLWSLVTDTLLSLIHNSKAKNGLKEKKEVKWLLFNYLKEHGSKKLKWPFQMAKSWWSKQSAKTLTPFLILFFQDNLWRKAKPLLWDLVLRM